MTVSKPPDTIQIQIGHELIGVDVRVYWHIQELKRKLLNVQVEKSWIENPERMGR